MASTGRLLWETRRIFTWSYVGRVAWAATIMAITLFSVYTTFWGRNEYVTARSDLERSQRKISTERLQKYPLDQKKALNKKRSFCPDNEVMSSSKVTKLGTYPAKKRFLAIGISSVRRPSGANYLLQTIQSLVNNSSDLDEEDIYVVTFLADLHESPKLIMKEELSVTFGKYIRRGFLIVIESNLEYYPELNNIKEKYGDSDGRRTWRSKENVDNVFVMCYCKELSQYYIHLEDDVKSSPSFFPKLQDFIAAQNATYWPIIDVATKGSVARCFHSQDLDNLASYFYLMYDEMPIDWLMDHWAKIKYPAEHFSDNKVPLASLFEHIGVTSSLAEKVSHNFNALEDFFDRYDQKYKGLNPPATVTSSLASHEGDPQDAYERGSGYFWSEPPQKGDYILIKFNRATAVKKIFVDTGSYRARDDLLYFAVLQASFESADVSRTQSGDVQACENFQTVGRFIEGKFGTSVDDTIVVNCFRILVTHYQAERIFLREIDIW